MKAIKKIVILSSIALTSIAANASTDITFNIINHYGNGITLNNPTPATKNSKHTSSTRAYPQDFAIANNATFKLPANWNGINSSYNKIPMIIVGNSNKTLCANLPEYNKYETLNMPKVSGTLTVNHNGECTWSSGNSNSEKLLNYPIPDIGKVIMGKEYPLNSNPIIQLGLYIQSTSFAYNYKSSGLAIHYTAKGLPTGLKIPQWGDPIFNPAENGAIYGETTSTDGCAEVSDHSGYYKCPITITAKEVDVVSPPSGSNPTKQSPIQKLGINQTVTSKFNLYLYNGLYTKSLLDLAAYNKSHSDSPIRLNIGINNGTTENIANLSLLFNAYDPSALNDITYTISDSANLSPINIVNQNKIPTSDFSISSQGQLSVKNLPNDSITQFTVIATNGLGQTAQETMYVNVSSLNKNGVPLYSPSSLLPTGTSAWVYGAGNACSSTPNSTNCAVQNGYIEKLNSHNISYMTPDMGYLLLAKKGVWQMNVKTPFLNNMDGTTIKETSEYYNAHLNNTKFILTVEFNKPLLGFLPSLTNAQVPGEPINKYGQNTNQLQSLEDSIINGLNSFQNHGMQFDLEPFSTQPRNLQFYKNISDRLARQGKIFELYAFANTMSPALALAASPLTIWLPSMYDVGGGSNPSQYDFDTNDDHYGTDTICHFIAKGAQGYDTNSWCNLNISDAVYQNKILFSSQKNQATFAKVTSTYGVHFQLGVPAEGSALNWSRLRIYNPSPIGKNGTNYTDIVAGQKPAEDLTSPTGNKYYIFESNRNLATGAPSTQAQFVSAFVNSAVSNGLGTPKTNPLNLGLALYALSNEAIVNGCSGGDKSKYGNCTVQEPVGISTDLPKYKQIDSPNGNYKVSVPVIGSDGQIEYSTTANPIWSIASDYLKGIIHPDSSK